MSYYKERLPDLIERLKKMVDENLKIIDQEATGDLTEDKMHNVLKGRKIAFEDSVWAMKKIEELEGELNGEKKEKQKSYAKMAAERRKG